MVKIRKVRKKTWGKRQSCASNPAVRSYRDAARRGFQQEGQSSSRLTMDALAKHDERNDDDQTMLDEQVDNQTTKTGKTFATVSIGGLTDCSNPTFAGVLKRFWQSPGANHKEICAVLAAVTEVIRKNGGSETETEYFAALMTALETATDDNSIGAISYLLALVIKRIPKSVLQVKFSSICQVILNILAVKADSKSTAILKSLVSCLAETLKVQEATVWSDSSTMKTFQALLTFTKHEKPKVRKSAQESVCLLLENVPGALEFHPGCQAITKYCIQEIDKYKGPNQAVSALHIIGLLRNIIFHLPNQQMKALCEAMLKLMTLGNVMLSVSCMQVLHNMFINNPKPSCVTTELNGQLINALFDYQPSCDDEQHALAWVTLMEKAYLNFQRLDNALCGELCPKLVSSCLSIFMSHHSTVKKTAAATAKAVFEGCLSPIAEKLCEEERISDSTKSPVLIILKLLESGLKYKYQAAWKDILDVIGKFFEIFGTLCPIKFKKCLISLCNLHNTRDIKCRRDIENVVGIAFRIMKPKFVLNVIPLDLDNATCEFPRSWLLPVMREHVAETELMYFFDKLLPLADTLHRKGQQYKSAGNEMEAKVYETLYFQIWDLLPGFCTKPTDIIQSFKGVAKTLGMLMTDKPELRLTICQALRNLITKNTGEEDIKELAKFSKNYLPILFNIYTGFEEKNEAVSLPILETLKCYIKITDEQLVKRFFGKAIEKVQDSGTTIDKKRMLMDLVIVMTSSVDMESVQRLYQFMLPWLQESDSRLQKKSYRVLEEICSGTSEATAKFVEENLRGIQETLANALSTASSIAKAPRLRCLVHVVKRTSAMNLTFFNTIIPEAILSAKEVNSKARMTSLKLLVEIGEAMIRTSDQSVQECVESYIGTLAAGFGGSPNMVSGTIIAISKILYEYKGSVSMPVLKQLITTLTNLLLSNKREIVKSALGFFKVAISVINSEDLTPFIPDLVVALVNWSEDSRNKFRFKAQVLFERLMRKFGYKTIHKLVPEKHRKFVHNIHKTVERAKRKKMQNHAERSKHKSSSQQIDSYEDLMFGSDDEEDEHANDGSFKAKKKEKVISKTFIRETNPDEPLDLLSNNISQHVSATEPVEKRKVADGGFLISDDGRLVITEDKSEANVKAEKSTVSSMLSEDVEMELSTKKNLKRKMDDEDDGEGFGKEKKKGNKIGEEYRAKKAGGDIKKKGKPDPYAYVPFNTQTLNKRKRAKLSGQYQGIVKGARKGAMQSKKRHRKN